VEAINFLTDCVWSQSPDIFTPKKLTPAHAPSCLDLEQVAMPMVHPTTGETISSYKKLMHDPATKEIWQRAFGKDFGGMAQGCNKTGQKGTNAIFIMTHEEIRNIPKDRIVTYARVVVDFRPQKDDPHRIRITAGGNLINYPGELLTRTADLTTSKLKWNSVLSTEGAKYMCLDIKKFYLSAPLDRFEYMKIPLALFPQWTSDQYDLTKHALHVSCIWKCNEQCGAYHRRVFWLTNSFAGASSPTGITNARTPQACGNTCRDQSPSR
jgi:hypothetical protein